MFRTPVDGFIPDFLRAQNIVRVIDGTGETKIGSSQREFELSRVGVTEGKLQGMYDGNPGKIDFGSSYRESAILLLYFLMLYSA